MKKEIKVPFGTISITPKAKRLINEALKSNRISSGRLVKEFEGRFARLMGTEEAVAVSSGTDAVTLALAVLYDYGAKRGDEVVVPALSFVSTGNAVLHAGFKPVFVDVEVETLNIDPGKIEEALTDRTVAILPVHLMGKPARMDEIGVIARRRRLRVIEDAAEAHGGRYKARRLGTMGDMGAFSLYIAHIITTGEGGIIVTDNSDYAEILRSLRAHGRACKCRTCILSSSSSYCGKRFNYDKAAGDIRFFFERVGYSSKMNELEAAIGLGNMDIYDKILSKRRKNLLYLIKKFKAFSGYFHILKEEEGETIGPHAFPLVLKEGVGFTRDELVRYLEDRGIETRSLFMSMPTQCPGFAFLGYKKGSFPRAEYIGERGLHFGLHQGLGRKDLDYIVETVEAFLAKRAR